MGKKKKKKKKKEEAKSQFSNRFSLERIMLIVVSVLLIAAVACSACNSNSVEPASQSGFGEGDEYEIYEAVLHDRFDSLNVLLVLRDSSVTSIRGQIPDSILAAYLKEHLPVLLDETIRSFVSVNGTPTSLMYVRNIPRLVLDSDYIGTHEGSKVNLSMSRVSSSSFPSILMMRS